MMDFDSRKNPQDVLYHYTNLSGLIGIVLSQALWSTSLFYLNDSSEVRHTIDLVRKEIFKRDYTNKSKEKVILDQFKQWLHNLLVMPPHIFVCSFTEKGNLLSQWRGYCRYGKGVSLGFDPEFLKQCASEQSFRFVQCVYDLERQTNELNQFLDHLIQCCIETGECEDSPPENSYFDRFDSLENELLSMSATFKNPAFSEEREWRVVSQRYTVMNDERIQYREGKYSLIPYICLILSNKDFPKLKFNNIYLGPTPNIELSCRTVSDFLYKEGVQSGVIHASTIPFREF